MTTIDIDADITGAWKNAATYEIDFTNNGNYFKGWTMEIDVPYEITKIWNAEIVSREGTKYIIKDRPWNDDVQRGETTTLGFLAKGEVVKPDDFVFNGQSIEVEPEEVEKPKSPPTSENGVSRPSYNKSKGFFTLNGQLYDANGHEFVARGVNNAHYLDMNGREVDNPYNDIDNIAGFGANSTRIVWQTHRNTKAHDRHLEKVIQTNIDNNMIPLVDAAHEVMGKTNPSEILDKAVGYYVERADLWEKYEKHAILQIGNEFGDWKMSKNQREKFPQIYKEAVTRLRDAGIDNTLVFSTFHWGKDYTLIREYGQEIINHDPQKNVMFDLHFYSGEGESKAKIADAFDSLTGKEIPFLIGEFASEHPKKGWKHGTPVYDIEDEFIMSQAEEHGVGYYPWAWNEWEPELGRLALANWGADSRDDLTPDGQKLILDDPNSIANTAEIASIFE